MKDTEKKSEREKKVHNKILPSRVIRTGILGILCPVSPSFCLCVSPCLPLFPWWMCKLCTHKKAKHRTIVSKLLQDRDNALCTDAHTDKCTHACSDSPPHLMHTAAVVMDSYAAAMVEEGLTTDSSSGTQAFLALLLLFFLLLSFPCCSLSLLCPRRLALNDGCSSTNTLLLLSSDIHPFM